MPSNKDIEKIINKNLQLGRIYAISDETNKLVSFFDKLAFNLAPKEAKKKIINMSTPEGLILIKKTLKKSIEDGWKYE